LDHTNHNWCAHRTKITAKLSKWYQCIETRTHKHR